MQKQTPLRKWLKTANAMNDIFNRDRIRYPKTPAMCRPIFAQLAGELSPENLCCDGELPRSQVQARARKLWAAWAELEGIYGSEVDEAAAWDMHEPVDSPFG